MCFLCDEMAAHTLEQSRRADEKLRTSGRSPTEMMELRRRAAVQGLATAAEMGMMASPAFMALVQSWVRGELTSEEVARKIVEMELPKTRQSDE